MGSGLTGKALKGSSENVLAGDVTTLPVAFSTIFVNMIFLVNLVNNAKKIKI